MMDIQDTIRKIKTDLRLSMNGVASAYMRENGMDYKLNFGVEIPRLREIARDYPVNHKLAQPWTRSTRKSRRYGWNRCPRWKSRSTLS